MKKILIFIALAGVSLFAYSQSTVLLRGDTIKVYKQGGTAVLRVDSIIMLTKYRQGASTDSVLTWDGVSKTLRMMDKNSFGSTYTANLPVRVTGTVISLDTSFAYNPSVVTNLRLQKLIDSLAALGYFNAQRFGKSGEDVTPAESRTVDFTSTYDFWMNHIRFGNLTADSSSGSTGYANVSVSRVRNQAVVGTFRRVSGSVGQNASWFQSDWNSSNTYAQIASSQTGVLTPTNYFRTYADSLSITLGSTSIPLNINNIPYNSGAALVGLAIDTLTNRIYRQTAGGGSGTNNANVGSGYRWLKPGTQEIKTAFAGFGNLIDSSSNTDGLTWKTDTASVTSKAAMQKAIDSLKAVITTAQTSSGLQYDVFDNFRSNDSPPFGFYKGTNGTGAVVTALSSGTAPTGWMYGYDIAHGTAYGSSSFWISSVSTATPNGINITSAFRYNTGAKVRLPVLSDVTDNYQLWFGFMTSVATDYTSNSNGAIFRYTSGDSSGKWIMRTKTGGTATEVASSVTVAANTDYELEISIFGGSVYFYINGTLAGTISTNVPTGGADCSMGAMYSTSVSGVVRRVYVDWAAEGVKKL